MASDSETSQPKKNVNFGIVDTDITPRGGFLLKKVLKHSSLGKAKIGAGDEILLIAGKKMVEPYLETVPQQLRELGVGTVIKVRISRAGKLLDVPVKLLAKHSFSLDVEEVSEALERKIAP